MISTIQDQIDLVELGIGIGDKRPKLAERGDSFGPEFVGRVGQSSQRVIEIVDSDDQENGRDNDRDGHNDRCELTDTHGRNDSGLGILLIYVTRRGLLVPAPLHLIRAILLIDLGIREVVGILISGAVPQRSRPLVVGIA